MPPNGLDAAGATVLESDRPSDRKEEPTDGELFARVADGSSDAFEVLYARYFQELYDYAARVTRDRAAAADIVQNAFTAVWERAKRGEQVRSPRAWLYRVTHNAAIDELRRRGWTTGKAGQDDFDFAAVEDVHAEEPTRVLIDKEVAELVWAAASSLDPQEYALLDLHVRRGLEPEELADELKVSTGAVYTRLSRLRRSFEEALTVTLLTGRGGQDCSELAGLLTTLGEEAESSSGRRSIRAHIQTCPICQAAKRRRVTPAAILASLAPVPLTPGVQDAIWAKVSALLGLSAGGGTATAASVPAAGGTRDAGRSVGGLGGQLAAGAAVAAALVVASGLVVRFAFTPAPVGGTARDPARVWSSSSTAGKPSTRNRITIAWSRQPAATAYSVLWSHGPRDEPDTAVDLTGAATHTISPALPPGRWYFHLRTRGRDGSWTHTVHLGPFIVLVPAAAAGVRAEGQAAGGSTGRGTAHTQPPAAETRRPPAAESGSPAAAAAQPQPAPPATESGAPAAPAAQAPFPPPAADRTAPSGQKVELVGDPYVRALAVALVLRQGTDLGSGVDPASGVVQRQSTNLADGECGNWSSWGPIVLHAAVDTTVADGRCYRYRYRVSDRAGNVAPFSVPSGTARVDTTPPTVPEIALASTGADTAVTGTTLFYRPTGAGGTFSVTAISADAGSGISGVEFPGLTAGMSPTAATRRTARPYELAYTWVAGAAAAGIETVTAFDRAGNSSSSTFRIEPDANGPEGMSVSMVGGPWFAAASVPLLVSSGSDGGAGLLPESVILERDQARLVRGGCDAFPDTWLPLTLQTSADTSAVSGTCYRYRVSVSDRVGNRSTSQHTGDARIDTSPPSLDRVVALASSPRIHVSATTVYYRPGAAGSLDVTAPATDPESGIDDVSFPSLSGAAGGGSDDTPPYETIYGWTGDLAAAGTQTVTASNRAGLRTTSDFTLVPDADPPTGMHVTLAGGPTFMGSVPLTVDAGTDTGSGVDPATVRVERDTARLAEEACGRFTNAWTPVTLQGDLDASIAGGTCYRYRVVVDDKVGNRAASPPSATATVVPAPVAAFTLSLRATSPTTYANGTTLFYRADRPGSFIAEAVSTAGAKVDAVTFPLLEGADGGGVDESAPFASAYSWIVLAAAGPQPVTASNGSGGSGSASFTLQPDADPPTRIEATVAGGWFTGPVTVTIDAGTDSGSGIDPTSLRVERDSAPVAPGATCGAFAGHWTAVALAAGSDTSVADGSCYRYRAEIVDNVGNRAVSAPSATASVDTAAPTEVSVALAGGSQYVGAVPLRVGWGNDAGSGIDETSKLVERDSAPLAADATCGSFTGVWERVEVHGSSTVDNAAARDTCYRYRASVSDNAGNRATSQPSDVAKVR